MYRTYRASGKVEWYFFPLLLITLILIEPIGGGLCLLLMHYAPGTMWEVIALFTCGGILLELVCRICIGMGKVRNAAAAWIAGILSGLVFWYLLFVFGAVFFGSGQKVDIFHLDIPGLEQLGRQYLRTLVDFGRVSGEVKRIIQEGATIRGNTGTVLVTLRDVPLAAVTGLLCAGTTLFTGVCFYAQSKEPFCESTKRWCRESALYFTFIANEQAFLNRLLLGDCSVIQELEPLRAVNADYTKGTFYSDAQGGEYYITLENMRRKDSDSKKETPRYEESGIAEYVRLDRDTGHQLLTMEKSGGGRPVAELETRKTKLKRIWNITWRCLLLVGEAVIFMMALTGTGAVSGLISNGIFLFYVAASVIVSAVNFFGSFGKRYVLETEEDSRREYRSYEVNKAEKPLISRVYYMLMFFLNVLIVWICIRRM